MMDFESRICNSREEAFGAARDAMVGIGLNSLLKGTRPVKRENEHNETH